MDAKYIYEISFLYKSWTTKYQITKNGGILQVGFVYALFSKISTSEQEYSEKDVEEMFLIILELTFWTIFIQSSFLAFYKQLGLYFICSIDLAWFSLHKHLFNLDFFKDFVLFFVMLVWNPVVL